MLRKISLTAASAVVVLATVGAPVASAGAVTDRPAAVAQRAQAAAPADNLAPGPYHRTLDPLVGTWKAVKYNYILGTGGKPIVSRDMTVRVRWISKTGAGSLRRRPRGPSATGRTTGSASSASPPSTGATSGPPSTASHRRR